MLIRLIQNIFGRKNLKQYILVVDLEFPAGHSRSGEPTHFDSKIVGNDRSKKIHEICSKFDNWLDIAKDINSGKANLKICYEICWGNRSKYIPICCLNQINVQEAYFPDTPDKGLSVGDKLIPISDVASNEGLTENELVEWYRFFTGKPVYIIHFTHFAY